MPVGNQATLRLWLGVVALTVPVGSPARASDLTSALNEERKQLTYLLASCSDNPECQVGSLTCGDVGLELELIAVGSEDAAYLLRHDAGVRLKAGNQTAVLLPVRLTLDELNGGWDITFAAWRTPGEEVNEVVDAMTESALELVDVSRTMSIALPSGDDALARQVAFAEACRGS